MEKYANQRQSLLGTRAIHSMEMGILGRIHWVSITPFKFDYGALHINPTQIIINEQQVLSKSKGAFCQTWSILLIL
jgi:hypothetical protein